MIASAIPAGYRWCTSGTCGRLLPLSAFHRVGRGRWPDSKCKACDRVWKRNRYRRLSKKATYRLAMAAAARRRYWSNAEPRERIIARATANKARRRAEGRAA